MHEVVLQSDWDTFLYAVPLILALLIGFFRLDEHISSPQRKNRVRRTLTGCDANGEPLFSDPDGRPWKHTSAS
jgi:hypothetical protein